MGRFPELDKHNPHGYFENKHVVMQNDAWLQYQGLAWTNASSGIYDPKRSCIVSDKNGCPSDSIWNLELAMLQYNMARNVPWVLKYPRLCITIVSWVQALDTNDKGNAPPAVLFTFRHPLEVALSLQERVLKGLELWIWYNRMAVANSRQLCRVVTSNEALVQDPVSEMSRIGEQLQEECRLPLKPVDSAAISKYFETGLFNQTETEDDCRASELSTSLMGKIPSKQEQEAYSKATKVYCDLERG